MARVTNFGSLTTILEAVAVIWGHGSGSGAGDGSGYSSGSGCG